MEQQGIRVGKTAFCCLICQNLLKDPVAIPCGHSYCMSCIKTFWDEEKDEEKNSCPQCQQTFMPRPVLVKNTILADLVEEVKKSELQAAPSAHCYAGPADVGCDSCTGRKRKATKSCLQCLVSYCDQHLQPHYDVAPLKKHKLTEASAKLQENICSRHDELMKIFCRTDQQCICYLCFMDEHKSHNTVSAAAEGTERQRELGASREKVQQRIQDREKDVKVLQQEMEAINPSADKAVKDNEEIFTQLIRVMEKISSDVMQQIRFQQESQMSRAEKLHEKLEQEIAELRRKDAELQQLSHIEDHIQFLQKYPSLLHLRESTDSASINIRPLRYFEEVTAAVSKVTDKLQNILSEEWTKISVTLTEPKTRADFLRYARVITMDPNTANTRLSLSEGNRKATSMTENQSYSAHPDRFKFRLQVLSTDSLTGRCYWEVERSKSGVVVAVAYKDIKRRGKESRFGYNEKSWSFYHYNSSCTFMHNSISTDLSVPKSSRVGVYLDHSAGLLSFYSVSQTMTLLYKVQTTFTQPLYAGICFLFVSNGATAEFCE
ncbi:E3 ubiquitin/ISG15 ligase TRIM25-like [Genypterus blacodes]|uniref:E3 ubiquitin/ISG15 ligase TRIM25-like n=1 Tax=Genypterus blacodes TaxID=154954 RepID=UPI003F75A52F